MFAEQAKPWVYTTLASGKWILCVRVGEGVRAESRAGECQADVEGLRVGSMVMRVGSMAMRVGSIVMRVELTVELTRPT
jgi:hypothetical protein